MPGQCPAIHICRGSGAISWRWARPGRVRHSAWWTAGSHSRTAARRLRVPLGRAGELEYDRVSGRAAFVYRFERPTTPLRVDPNHQREVRFDASGARRLSRTRGYFYFKEPANVLTSRCQERKAYQGLGSWSQGWRAKRLMIAILITPRDFFLKTYNTVDKDSRNLHVRL
jgi:hypothetical protein